MKVVVREKEERNRKNKVKERKREKSGKTLKNLDLNS